MADTPIYTPGEIEPKWQERWEREGLYNADIDPTKKKFYALTMLPYPSGDLHIGHWYAMTPSQIKLVEARLAARSAIFVPGAPKSFTQKD